MIQLQLNITKTQIAFSSIIAKYITANHQNFRNLDKLDIIVQCFDLQYNNSHKFNKVRQNISRNQQIHNYLLLNKLITQQVDKNITNMSAFEYYDRLRRYQLHVDRLDNVHIDVPNHEAYSPIKAKVSEAKEFQRQMKIESIERDNAIIMRKLLKINNRSSPNLSLPPIIKKPLKVPQHQQENNLIAKKIIRSKPSISANQIEKKYRSHEKRLKSLSKYDVRDGVVINRKELMAEMFLFKKMKESLVRHYKAGSNE